MPKSNASEERWLLLIHQIPPKPGYLRVKVGRRLQRVGAVPIKSTVYVLPSGDAAQEDFQWVLREIVAGGGDATICEARLVDGLTDEQVERLFNEARDADYREIAEAASRLRSDVSRVKRTDEQDARAEAELARLRRRLEQVTPIDFFGAPARTAAERAVAALEQRLQGGGGRDLGDEPRPVRPEDYRGRVWVTRRGIHVDRMASAWLVQRFIDHDARFKFVAGKGYSPEPGEVRFDMFEGEFTHEGDHCTFEVLVERMGLDDPALRRVAEVVHDIDLKDGKFGRDEALGVERLVAGIAGAHKDDEERLRRGGTLFDGLYESFRRRRT